MASGNGHDKMTERMVEILERIDAGMTDLRGEARATNARLDQTNARLDQTIGRLDHLIEITGSTYRDHEARIAKLEAVVSGAAIRTTVT